MAGSLTFASIPNAQLFTRLFALLFLRNGSFWFSLHTTRVVLKHRQIIEDNVAFSSAATALDYVSVSIVSTDYTGPYG